MQFPRIITRRRAKWTGLAATLCVAAAMIASYWYWPSYHFTQTSPRTYWNAHIEPGVIGFVRVGSIAHESRARPAGWILDSRYKRRAASSGNSVTVIYSPHPSPWLPSYDSANLIRSQWAMLTVPLWMPLLIAALPTGILFYRDHKPKPGCCAKCRYDLTGLSGNTCPECGTKIATTDSHKAPASTAQGKGDEAGGENGVGLEGNGVS